VDKGRANFSTQWYNLIIVNQNKGSFFERFFILSIASGILLALALPWAGFSWCVWFGLVPLFLFIGSRNTTYRQTFQGGMVTGLVYLSTVAYPLFSLNAWWWFQAQGVVYENKVILLFWILYLAVLIGSAILGVFAVIFKKLYREGLFSIIILAGAWVLLEYLRAQFLFGFTWGHLGYAAYDTPSLLQLGHFEGVYALSFLIILVNIFVYYAIHRAWELAVNTEGSTRGALFFKFLLKRWHLYAAVALFIVAFEAGSLLLTIKIPTKGELSVAVVQSGSHSTAAEDETATLSLLSNALRGGSLLAVVPESALPRTIFNEDTGSEAVNPFAFSLPRSEESAYQKLISISKEYPLASIAIGLDSTKGGKSYNSLIVFENGNPVSIYHKRLLFPFSERTVSWFPWKTTDPLGSGEANQTIAIQGKPADALVCSEILFPELLEGSSSGYVVAAGNDGVFDNPVVAEYNEAIARFAAVEARKYMVRAMKTGVSSIIDPYGRIIARSKDSREALLVDTISY
jgi:apolipoprotein N-acyltransferase